MAGKQYKKLSDLLEIEFFVWELTCSVIIKLILYDKYLKHGAKKLEQVNSTRN